MSNAAGGKPQERDASNLIHQYYTQLGKTVYYTVSVSSFLVTRVFDLIISDGPSNQRGGLKNK